MRFSDSTRGPALPGGVFPLRRSEKHPAFPRGRGFAERVRGLRDTRMARPAHGWTNALPDVRRATEAVLARAGSVADRVGWGAAGRRRGQGRRRSSGPPELLRQVLDDIELDRECVYLTNAVKHFEWRAKGKRGATTHRAGRRSGRGFWPRAELALLRPTVLVRLGPTAAQALLRRDARVGELRGRLLDVPDPDAGRRHGQPLRGAPGGCSAGRAAPGLAHDSHSRAQPLGIRVEAAQGG